MAMAKGLKQFWYSIVEKDDETGVICSTPKRVMGVNKISVKPTITKDSFDAEDKVYESVYSYGDTEVEITLADLPMEDQAALMGHTITGAEMIRSSADATNAPYVCIGYERTVTNSKSRFKWLYKGRFQPSDEDNESSGKAVKLKATTIKATFEGFNYNGDFDRTLDSDSANYTAGQAATFFDNPLKVYDSTLPTVTCNIADGATGIVVTTDVVFTFSEAIQSATAITDNIIVMGADGTAVAGALSIDATNEIVTFNPTASLAAAAAYIAIVTTAIKDLTGNKLANMKVVNFTTA